MKRKSTIPTAALLAGVLAIPGAHAATTSASININMNVLQGGSCTMSGTGMYPTYDPGSPNPTDTTSSINVTCSFGTPWTLAFDEGANPAAGSSCAAPARQVANGSSVVGYSLYSDNARTQPLGCDASNDMEGTGTGSPQYPFVYFRAPAGQSPTAAGAHTDTVVMTLTF